MAEKRQLMSDFASCTVRRWRSGVERYLDTAPGSHEAEDMAKRLSVDTCLASGEMAFEEPLYRAAAYEAMYRIKFVKEGVSDFSTIAPLDYAQAVAGGDGALVAAQTALRRLADCAVRHGPVEARKLILSPIGGPKEAAAFSTITPFISSCMTHDVTVTFSKISLRGYIGEALYRLSIAAQRNAGMG